MDDRLASAADELVRKVPPGPSVGQLRARLQSRRRHRLGVVAAMTLLVVVNGLVVLADREPEGYVPVSAAEEGGSTSSTSSSTSSTSSPTSSTSSPTSSTASTVAPTRPPEANDDLGATVVNQLISLQVLANDVDPDGGVLRVDSVQAPTVGTVALTDGIVTFAPPTDFVGIATFTYAVADDTELTSTGTVTIIVTDAPET
ncbi:MAG: Ig-like domain-containing protein [Actinobacteria bacterium]|nr:Ig-like domain-containing protein [Actinomycetota bacterium]